MLLRLKTRNKNQYFREMRLIIKIKFNLKKMDYIRFNNNKYNKIIENFKEIDLFLRDSIKILMK
jgi:hypothetical protein